MNQLEQLLRAVPDAEEQFFDACTSITDWPAFIGLAAEHGVLAVLSSRLDAAGIADGRQLVHRQCAIEELAQERMIRALEEALAALAAAGVVVGALKGPVLGERLYGNASIRPSTDLDLLVAPADLARAIQALGTLDYTPLRNAEEEYYRQQHHHVHLVSPRRPTIELHFRLTSGFGVLVPSEPFLERSSSYQTRQGGNCRVLAAEDELVYLAQHAAGHAFSRLGWLYDLKMLQRAHPTLDWDLACNRAAAVGLRVPLLFCAEMLERRLGVSLGKIRGARWRRGVGRWLLPMLGSRPFGAVGEKLFGLAYEAALSDRLSAVIPLCRRRLAHWRVSGV